MLFCQLAHADSLREIYNGLGCCVGKLVHLGIARVADSRWPVEVACKNLIKDRMERSGSALDRPDGRGYCTTQSRLSPETSIASGNSMSNRIRNAYTQPSGALSQSSRTPVDAKSLSLAWCAVYLTGSCVMPPLAPAVLAFTEATSKVKV
jgi:hypothetical protein